MVVAPQGSVAIDAIGAVEVLPLGAALIRDCKQSEAQQCSAKKR